MLFLLLGLILIAAAVAVLVALVVGDNGATQVIAIFGQHIHSVSVREVFVAGLITGAVGMLGLAMMIGGSRRAGRRAAERRMIAEKREVEAQNARIAAQRDEAAGRHRAAEDEAVPPAAQPAPERPVSTGTNPAEPGRIPGPAGPVDTPAQRSPEESRDRTNR